MASSSTMRWFVVPVGDDAWLFCCGGGNVLFFSSSRVLSCWSNSLETCSALAISVSKLISEPMSFSSRLKINDGSSSVSSVVSSSSPSSSCRTASTRAINARSCITALTLDNMDKDKPLPVIASSPASVLPPPRLYSCS